MRLEPVDKLLLPIALRQRTWSNSFCSGFRFDRQPCSLAPLDITGQLFIGAEKATQGAEFLVSVDQR